MTRIALISAALFVTLAGAVAGGILYLRPAFIFGAPEVTTTTAHGVPDYNSTESRNAQTRKNALHLVERLGAVQDRIIRGDRGALADQSRLLNDISRAVRDFDQDDWKDYANVRTSFLYVLSGGDAHVLKPLATAGTLNYGDQQLANGIMSFAEGQPKKARELFENIDPRSLDVSLVGPFALARASLYIEDDSTRAIALLDDARLACPHTAIEEAAARREIPLLVNTDNTDRAMMLTTSYVREFGRSIYAWKFYRQFSEAVAKRPEMDSIATVDRIAGSINDSDLQPASELFAYLAGEALLQGRLELAKAAAKKVLATENASPSSQIKARLYLAAAEAPSDAAGNALQALDQIGTGGLSEDDAEISEVAGFIAKWVVGDENVQSNKSASAVVSKNVQPNDVVKEATALKASAAISDVDAILKKADTIIARSAR
jgi:chemotaxis protein MotC